MRELQPRRMQLQSHAGGRETGKLLSQCDQAHVTGGSLAWQFLNSQPYHDIQARTGNFTTTKGKMKFQLPKWWLGAFERVVSAFHLVCCALVRWKQHFSSKLPCKLKDFISTVGLLVLMWNVNTSNTLGKIHVPMNTLTLGWWITIVVQVFSRYHFSILFTYHFIIMLIAF